MKRFRRGEVGAAVRACVLLSVLLLPTPTVCVIPVFDSGLLEQAATPLSDAHLYAQPTYWVAPTEDPGIPSAAVDTSARALEKEIRSKLADSERVKEAKDIYRKVTDCPSYPCEVVVEEVNVIGDSLYFRLELKTVRPPRDRSPQSPHPGIDKPYKCTVTSDMTADDCRGEAPEKLAYALKLHDQAYHRRNQ